MCLNYCFPRQSSHYYYMDMNTHSWPNTTKHITAMGWCGRPLSQGQLIVSGISSCYVAHPLFYELYLWRFLKKLYAINFLYTIIFYKV